MGRLFVVYPSINDLRARPAETARVSAGAFSLRAEGTRPMERKKLIDLIDDVLRLNAAEEVGARLLAQRAEREKEIAGQVYDLRELGQTAAADLIERQMAAMSSADVPKALPEPQAQQQPGNAQLPAAQTPPRRRGRPPKHLKSLPSENGSNGSSNGESA